MFITTFKQIKQALVLFIVITLLTGLLYPMLVTAIAQFFFPWEANGSLIQKNGQVIGSTLIGQSFDEPYYFWGRPSATLPFPYNAANSAASNYGPLNPDFLALVKTRLLQIHDSDSTNKGLVPVDLVTASASGLDPDISPSAALYQVSRIAKAREMTTGDLVLLIHDLIKHRSLMVLGEPRVNVLELNQALDNQRSDDVRTAS
jgi:potassium-transporting ATPase KdpC subunit